MYNSLSRLASSVASYWNPHPTAADSAIVPLLPAGTEASRSPSPPTSFSSTTYILSLTLSGIAALYLILSRVGASTTYGYAAGVGTERVAREFAGIDISEDTKNLIFWIATLANAYFASAAHLKKIVDTITHVQALWHDIEGASHHKCDGAFAFLMLMQVSTLIYAAVNAISCDVSLGSISFMAAMALALAIGYGLISMNFNAHYVADALKGANFFQSADGVRRGIGFTVLSFSLLAQCAYYVLFLNDYLQGKSVAPTSALTAACILSALTAPSMYYAQGTAVVAGTADGARQLVRDWHPKKTDPKTGVVSYHFVTSGLRVIADATTLLLMIGSVLSLLEHAWSSEDLASQITRGALATSIGTAGAYTYSVNNLGRGQKLIQDTAYGFFGILVMAITSLLRPAPANGSSPRRTPPPVATVAAADSTVWISLSASSPTDGLDGYRREPLV